MILIDFNHLFLANIFAQTRGRGEISETLVRHTVLSCLLSYKKHYSDIYGEIVICADSKHSWRKEVFKYYKANRRKNRESSGLNWTSIFDSLNKIREEIKENLPYRVLEIYGAEADDVIACLVKHTELYPKKSQYKFSLGGDDAEQVLILSGDNDFVQLQTHKHVKQYAPVQKKFLVSKDPTGDLFEKILRGDSGDGIPNILSDDDTFANPDKSQKPLRESKLKVLLEGGPLCLPKELSKNFERNSHLIDFTYIPKEIEEKIVREYLNQSPSRKNMMNYFIKNRLKNLMEHITEF